PLFEALAPITDLPVSLFRGRYASAVVDMEANGIPIDIAYLRELESNWQALRMFYIKRDDALGLYDDDGTFKEARLEAVARTRKCDLPRAPPAKRRGNGRGSRQAPPATIPNCARCRSSVTRSPSCGLGVSSTRSALPVRATARSCRCGPAPDATNRRAATRCS